jgi:hypothetical protein
MQDPQVEDGKTFHALDRSASVIDAPWVTPLSRGTNLLLPLQQSTLVFLT